MARRGPAVGGRKEESGSTRGSRPDNHFILRGPREIFNESSTLINFFFFFQRDFTSPLFTIEDKRHGKKTDVFWAKIIYVFYFILIFAVMTTITMRCSNNAPSLPQTHIPQQTANRNLRIGGTTWIHAKHSNCYHKILVLRDFHSDSVGSRHFLEVLTQLLYRCR